MRKHLGFKVIRDDAGTALIWFVFLVALLCLVVLTLATSVHQYLFARELIDFTEQFAVAVKTKLQIEETLPVSSAAKDLLSAVASQYSFPNLQLRQVSLESGETVRVVFCAEWVSPLREVSASRTICEIALAR
jgi:Flp pilus assembly protein TadG